MRRSGILLLLPLVFQVAAADDGADGWQFQLTPYVWLPTISGKLNYDLPAGGGDGAPRIDVGPTDWLDLLNGVFLLRGEARKDRFFVFADVVYLGLESDNDRVVAVSPGSGDLIPIDASVNLDTKTDLDGFTMTLAGGLNVHSDETSSTDLFAGVRFFGMDTKTSWNLSADIELPGGGNVLSRQGSIESDLESWDAVVGTKGRMRIGNGKWSLPYYLDVGTGDSDLTWQAIAGVSYAYSWGDLIISYRHFEYDGGPQGLMENFSFSGPVIGGRFTW
jgi:hypothetical protein